MTRIPRIRLAALPTPVEFLPHLSAELKGPQILIKRDDLTGLAFGGNKTRKLEFVLAEALAAGARTLVTVGAVQSNHCRQTAALAARAGLDCILVLSGAPESVPSGNLYLDRMFGAEIVWTSYNDRAATLQKTVEMAWEAGRRPYVIPLGASNALGTLAYESAFQEFAAQSVQADWIVVASSSGGTQAGLVLGARRVGWAGKILGISIDRPEKELTSIIASLVNQAADLSGESENCLPEDILVNDHYLGEGYGILGKPEMEAIRLFSRREGILLDPVYTSRAAAGLIDLVDCGIFKPGEMVLFWHTGGTPALFAQQYSSALNQFLQD